MRTGAVASAVVLAIASGLGATSGAQGGTEVRAARAEDLRQRVAALAEQLPQPLGGNPVAMGATEDTTPRASLAADRLERTFGNRFAGAWDLPQARGLVPIVALIEPTPTDRVIATSVVGSAVRVVSAQRSITELRELESEVVAELDGMGVGAHMVGVHVPTNTLEVLIDQDAPLDAAGSMRILELAEQKEVVVQSVPMGETAYPNPEWGGQRVYLGIGGNTFGACTTGFAMRNAAGVLMTTAAHCTSGNGQPVRGASGDGNATIMGQVSTVVGWQPPVTVPGDFAAFYYEPAVGFINSVNRAVKGARNPTWLEQNICFRGATSRVEKCGGVSNVNMVITTSGGRQFRGFCIDHGSGTPTLEGDSGSAMYLAMGASEAHARGIVAVRSGSRTCGTPIGTVMSTYNASIMVK